MTIHICTDKIERYQSFTRLLGPGFETEYTKLGGAVPRQRFQQLVVAVDLSSARHIEMLRTIEHHIRLAKKRLFIIESASRLQQAQAYSLGATKVLFLPTAADLIREFEDVVCSSGPADDATAAASIGEIALRDVFSSVANGYDIDLRSIDKAGEKISSSIAQHGLLNWLNVVRSHHEGTYQHCLLVTGVAIGFGQHLRMSSKDVARLSSAALVHDIGKAVIPTSILDKPGKLDDEERAKIETHPREGFLALQSFSEAKLETLDCVLHHHEFLDGSGYPDGLGGSEICDLVRILTISDIFGALIERRSYRQPMDTTSAYEILRQMSGNKLEGPLVAAFRSVAMA